MSKDLIELFKLEPHPEGGMYRRTFSAQAQFKDETGKRAVGSAIYYYLASNDFSAWHRLDAEEMLHFYAGTSMTVHVIDPKGNLTHVNLGDPSRSPNLVPQFCVPKGHWMSLEVDCENTFGFVGATVFPAFKMETFEIAKRAELVKQYPQHKDIIERLTRE